MKYSLIIVYSANGDKVSGRWLQDHIGTLQSAKEEAADTMKANGDFITVAVVEQLDLSCPTCTLHRDLLRLN